MPGSDRQAFGDLALLRDAAKEAGAIAMRWFRQNPEVWMKAGSSPVSEADYAVDNFLRETLLAARPDYGWLSEETADGEARHAARRVFVVDPIDGTRGFLEGREDWCVSVAVVEGGKSLAGVLQCPARHECFWAEAGQGAFLNGSRLSVARLVGEARIAGPKPLVEGFGGDWPGGVHRAAYIPSLAYRIAMIAAGRIDATFIKPNSKDWDLAAADLILAEAGGQILDKSGNAPTYAGRDVSHGGLVAGSGALLDAMRERLSKLVPN